MFTGYGTVQYPSDLLVAWCILMILPRLPPGHILTERAKTSGTPDVVSGSSMTVVLLDLIIFLVPSQVQMMPTKLINVKSVPKMTGHCMCLQTMKDG